jgi:aspartate/methionine/tyrosine aminotransferase
MIRPHPIYAALGTTIFETMSRLAEAHGAINLGQGFPDETAPREVLDRACEAILTGSNQYPSMHGLPALRKAVAAHEARHWNLARKWDEEIVVTSGATEALAASLLAYVSEGDEVIVFEPLYDAYVPLIRRAGGRPVPVRLEPPGWRLDTPALTRALSPKTRAILLNDPLNPAAKVYELSELEAIAALAQAADLIVIVDAVYEHLTFDGRKHIPLASLPGMIERTLKIGSAGKIFSATGWKVGWVTGPAELVRIVAKAHQFLTFTTPPNLQAAVAYGLDEWDAWITGLKRPMQEKRDHLAHGLVGAGMRVMPAEGTYFLNASLAGTAWAGKDAEYCRHITETARVAAIPLSAFYIDKPEASTVRFCFAKRPEVLDGAIERLKAMKN